MTIKNFLFHRVSEEKDMLWPPMPPKLFEDIILFLMKKYQVVTLEEYLTNPQALYKRNIVTLSFDDGYKDNIDYAAPILKKYNCPASFYIVTDCADRNVPTWTYLVDYSFQNAEADSIELGIAYVPEHLKKIELNNGSIKNLRLVKPWMKSLSNKKRKEVLMHILDACKVDVPRHLMMNWNEIRQLSNDGFYISSHSHTHPMLAKLETEDEIREELVISYKKIQEQLGVQASTISYPMGSFDKRVIKLAKETGYKYGLAVEQKFFEVNSANSFAIPRVELYSEPKWKIHFRISGIYSTVKQLWK